MGEYEWSDDGRIPSGYLEQPKFTKEMSWLSLTGKESLQSSTMEGGIAGRAIDGNLNSDFSARSCTHTASEENTWWKVDLGQSYQVHAVRITNRGDCCQERLGSFSIHVDNTECRSNCCDYWPGVTKLVICKPGAVGQYVQIRQST